MISRRHIFGLYALLVVGGWALYFSGRPHLRVLDMAVTNPNLENAQASNTSGQLGPLVQAAATTSPPSYTTGKTYPLSLDTSGNLRTSILSLPSTLGSVYLLDYGGTNQGGINSAHQQYVDIEGQKNTFVAGITGLAVSTSATDIFCVGATSGTKTFHITQAKISGTATAASTITASIVIRSTDDTGGTSTSPTVYKMNTTSGTAASGSAAAYTANPSALGTVASVVDEQAGTLPTATSSAVAVVPIDFLFGDNNEAQAIFNGSTYEACINLGGAAPSGASLSIMMRWTEE